MSSPHKILAMKLRAMGDTVLMSAPLLAIRERFPRAEIHAVVLKPWATLLDHHPAVQKVWLFERHADPIARARAAARLAFMLRKEQFDCVVNFHASPTSSMIAFATGAKLRAIHFHGHSDRNRYSTVDVPGKGVLKPIIERDMDAVRALGVSIETGKLPQIFLTESERREGFDVLQRLKLEGPVLMLGLGASRPTKRWPMDRFASIAVSWCQATKGSVALIAASQEQELIQSFQNQLESLLSREIIDTEERRGLKRRIAPLPPQSVRKLAAVIAHARLLVGNDSGPRHLAVAVRVPTITIFGPEHPFEWHPYPKELHPYFFIDPLHCRKDADPGMPPWCSLHECVLEGHKCMREIQTHHVFEACRRFIS